MNVTTKISVDLTKPNICTRVNAVQGDGNTRYVEVKLLSGRDPWEPPEGVEPAVAYRKPDYTKGLYNKLADGDSAITISGNVATIILAPQMLTTAGTVQAVLMFNDAQLNRLTTFPFSVSVAANPGAGAQKSEDYIRLQWLENKLDEYLKKFEGGVDEATVQRIVEEYLAANPPTVTETDPTVPAWAKQPSKPAYTAAEVGALSAETLPVAINTALAQAKDSGEFDGDTGPAGPQGEKGPQGATGPAGATPNIQIGTVETLAAGSSATASIDGTPENPVLNLGIPKGDPGTGGGSGIAVTGATVGQTVKIAAVDDDGAPTAWEPVDLTSGVHTYRHIETITIPDGEEIAVVSFTIPAKTRKLFVVASTNSSNTFATTVRANVKNGNIILAALNVQQSMGHRKALFYVELYDDIQFISFASSNSGFSATYPGHESFYDYASYFSASNNTFVIYVYSSSTNKYFAAGCTFALYALCEE